MGQEDTLTNHEIVDGELEGDPDETESATDNWCIYTKVLSLQENFANEKPMKRQT